MQTLTTVITDDKRVAVWATADRRGTAHACAIASDMAATLPAAPGSVFNPGHGGRLMLMDLMRTLEACSGVKAPLGQALSLESDSLAGALGLRVGGTDSAIRVGD